MLLLFHQTFKHNTQPKKNCNKKCETIHTQKTPKIKKKQKKRKKRKNLMKKKILELL